MIALFAAAHLYLFQWPGQPPKALFLLPSEGENACAVGSLTFGAPDNSWSSGSAGAPASCDFLQSVEPGSLLPSWVDAGKITAGSPVEVTWTLQGGHASGKGHTATLQAEVVAAAVLDAAPSGLSGTVTKVKNSARVLLRNGGSGPILVGDAIAARSRPTDSCVGGGPQALLQPGESISDTRPGLVSKSMQIWVAAFSAPKQCRWVAVQRR